jgi:hypothetical protein
MSHSANQKRRILTKWTSAMLHSAGQFVSAMLHSAGALLSAMPHSAGQKLHSAGQIDENLEPHSIT